MKSQEFCVLYSMSSVCQDAQLLYNASLIFENYCRSVRLRSNLVLLQTRVYARGKR